MSRNTAKTWSLFNVLQILFPFFPYDLCVPCQKQVCASEGVPQVSETGVYLGMVHKECQ